MCTRVVCVAGLGAGGEEETMEGSLEAPGLNGVHADGPGQL